MIADSSKKASIFAYYLSKFDRDAIRELGYNTLKEAFQELSHIVGKDNNYIKLRRDEFDPLTGSHRLGWHKRSPAPAVVSFHNGLKNYTFEEMTQIVQALILDTQEFTVPHQEIVQAQKIVCNFSEEELEMLINGRDSSSKIIQHQALVRSRVFDPRIPNSLKKLYECRCQICGARTIEMYNVDISEAHHIEHFSKTANNNASNILIVCPDHHRIIHKAKPVFKRELLRFEYENGKNDELMYNFHL